MYNNCINLHAIENPSFFELTHLLANLWNLRFSQFFSFATWMCFDEYKQQKKPRFGDVVEREYRRLVQFLSVVDKSRYEFPHRNSGTESARHTLHGLSPLRSILGSREPTSCGHRLILISIYAQLLGSSVCLRPFPPAGLLGWGPNEKVNLGRNCKLSAHF